MSRLAVIPSMHITSYLFQKHGEHIYSRHTCCLGSGVSSCLTEQCLGRTRDWKANVCRLHRNEEISQRFFRTKSTCFFAPKFSKTARDVNEHCKDICLGAVNDMRMKPSLFNTRSTCHMQATSQSLSGKRRPLRAPTCGQSLCMSGCWHSPGLLGGSDAQARHAIL